MIFNHSHETLFDEAGLSVRGIPTNRRIVDAPRANLLEGIGGLIGGAAVAAGAAGKGGGKERKKALQAWEKLRTSDFDFTALDPPELQVLQEQLPELYDAVVPEEFRQVADSGARENQVKALSQMEAIAKEGLPIEDRLAAAEAARSVTGAAYSARKEALRNIAARGALSSGDAIQADIAGNQQGANLARDLGSDLARQAALRRMAGIESAGAMAGNLRAADVDVNARNADIANRFAELFSSMRTQQNRDNAAARERAAAANVARRNEVGDANAINRYTTALENLNRQNALRGQQFGQQLQKTAGVAGALNDYGAYKDALRDMKAQALVSTGKGAGGIGDSLLGGVI